MLNRVSILMFRTFLRGAKLRLSGGTVDEHPQLQVRNTASLLGFEFDELEVTAQSWLVGIDEDTDWYMRSSHLVNVCIV